MHVVAALDSDDDVDRLAKVDHFADDAVHRVLSRGNVAGRDHVVPQHVIFLALGQQQFLSIGRQDDAVGKRQAAVDQFPQLRAVLAELGGKVTGPDMRHLNYLVDAEQRDVAAVVRDFRQSHNL